MKENDLIKTALDIDMPDKEKIMERCMRNNKRKKFTVIKAAAACAACLAIAVTGGVLLSQQREKTPTVSQSAQAAQDYKRLEFNKAKDIAQSDIYIEGHFWRTLTDSECAALFPSLSKQGKIDATANFQSGPDIFNVDAVVMLDGIETKLITAYGKVTLDYILEADAVTSDVNGVKVTASSYTNNWTTWSASFKKDNVAYYLENQGGEEASEVLSKCVYLLTKDKACDLNSIPTGEIPKLIDKKLTLQQAKADELYGKYVPEVPSRFSFEEAQRFKNQDTDELYVRFTNGMNEISVNISPLTQNKEALITSVNDTVNYDLSLYPIPRCDSVPKALQEIVDNPIFRIDELTADAVTARAYTPDDSGDSDECRINFSVLIENTVVRISSKGASPKEIYDSLTR